MGSGYAAGNKFVGTRPGDSPIKYWCAPTQMQLSTTDREASTTRQISTAPELPETGRPLSAIRMPGLVLRHVSLRFLEHLLVPTRAVLHFIGREVLGREAGVEFL